MRRFVRAGSVFLMAAFAAVFPLMTTPALSQELQSHVSAPADAKLIGRMPATQRLNLALSLPLRDEDQLNALLRQLYDPASPNYRHFLTVQQFTDQFGPTVVDYSRVTGFAQSHGLKVTHTFAHRLVVDVSGPVASIEQAFHVRMQVYQHPTENRTFYAPDVEPTFDPDLDILSVVGLSTFDLPHSRLKRASPNPAVHSDTTGSGQGGQFLGSDMRTAYGGGTLLDGTGQVVGLIELGPYRLNDVTSYFMTLGQPLNVPIVNVLVGVNGICGVSCDDGEEVIDIQQAISMAPNLSGLLVYETNGPTTDALSAYAQAASDNVAKQLSISFGWGDIPGSTTGKAYEQVFEELEAQGTSSFVASGDAGASLSGGYPGNSPNITDAGGTDLTTGAGQVWSSESGWIGSGGGWNTQSPIPTTPAYSWNQLPAINSSNGGDPSFRNIPDVASEANTDNYFCANGSCQGGIGGTSLAAPRWAAFVALINQQATANASATGNPTFGFLNPTIYTLSSGNYAGDFHDITTGNNATTTACTVGTLGCLPGGVVGFDAVTGFDLVTGWGSPNGPTIFNSLFPTTTNANFSMAATPSVLPLTAGNGGSSSISVTAVHGFNATTNLTVVIPGTGTPSYAPPGLTANLSATSIPAGGGPVTLTIGTTSATPGGTFVIAVVGTSGGLTQTAYVTVELPAFVGLSATPAAGSSLNQGATANATITSTLINGFNGTVNLSASGLPSGVTAAFTPVNSTTTTATFTASATAALTGSGKPTAVTITGTATGSSSQQTAVNLFVNPAVSGGDGTAVDLSSDYNVSAFYTDADEAAITTGLDGVGFAYSANILNAGLDFNGVQFTFGAANRPNAVYGTGGSVALPAGNFATLQLLATGIEGNQASQPVTVTYTDSSTSQFTQSFSDWCSGLNGGGCTSTGGDSGESVAVAMPYRDSAGGPDDRVFYLYHYSFALNASKTVQSVTLPNNRDVVVLAATLTAPPPSYSLAAPQTTTPSSMNAGGSSTATVTLIPVNGYTGSITLSCSITPVVTGADAPTCSFGNTSPVSITSSAAATATVTFTTVSPGAKAFRRATKNLVVPPSPRETRSGNPLYASWIVVPGLALMGFGFSSRGSHRKKFVGLALVWIMLAGLIILPACGGGSRGGGGGGGCSSVPSVPTGLAASSTTSSGTTLNWTAATASAGCTVTGYTVYQNNASITTTTNPTYTVTGLASATQYNFSVTATDSAGASAQSTAISVTTLSNGTPSGTYTITITGRDASGVTQTGNPATVTAVVN